MLKYTASQEAPTSRFSRDRVLVLDAAPSFVVAEERVVLERVVAKIMMMLLHAQAPGLWMEALFTLATTLGWKGRRGAAAGCAAT